MDTNSTGFLVSTIESYEAENMLTTGYGVTPLANAVEEAMNGLYNDGFKFLILSLRAKKANIQCIHCNNETLMSIVLHNVNVDEYSIIPIFCSYSINNAHLISHAIEYLRVYLKDHRGTSYSSPIIYLHQFGELTKSYVSKGLLELGYVSTGSVHNQEGYVLKSNR